MSSRSPRNSVSPDAGGLVGRAVIATIGEPWDFASSAGDNVLVGRVTAVSGTGESVEWITCEVSPFDVGGVAVATVAAVRRYAGEEPVEQLRQRGVAQVQLLYDPTGAALPDERIRAALSTGPGGLQHMVGSLRLS